MEVPVYFDRRSPRLCSSDDGLSACGLRPILPRMTGEETEEVQTPRSLNTPLAILKASRLAGMPQ